MSNNNISCKVVLVGDTGVGKTSIIDRYVKNEFYDEVESTISSTYSYKIIDYKEYNKSISLSVINFSIPSIFSSVHFP